MFQLSRFLTLGLLVATLSACGDDGASTPDQGMDRGTKDAASDMAGGDHKASDTGGGGDSGAPDMTPADSQIDVMHDQGAPDAALICKKIPCGCKLKGKDLWGKVYFAKYKNQADFVVAETKFQAQAGLIVNKVKYSTQASKCGRWYEVTTSIQADFKVYLTTVTSQADFLVYYTNFSSQAGQPCSFCP